MRLRRGVVRITRMRPDMEIRSRGRRKSGKGILAERPAPANHRLQGWKCAIRSVVSVVGMEEIVKCIFRR